MKGRNGHFDLTFFANGKMDQMCPNCAQRNVTGQTRTSPNAARDSRKLLQIQEMMGFRSSRRRSQNPPGFGPWGFDSPSRHHSPTVRSTNSPQADCEGLRAVTPRASHHPPIGRYRCNSELRNLLLLLLLFGARVGSGKCGAGLDDDARSRLFW